MLNGLWVNQRHGRGPRARLLHVQNTGPKLDDVFGDVGNFELHVFETLHRSHQVKIIDFNCHVSCARSGNDTIEENLNDEEIYCGSAAIDEGMDFISSHDEARSVWIFLLGPVIFAYAAIHDVLTPVG